MPAIFNIEVYRGDTWDGQVFTVSLNGAPIDLTGCTIRMQVRLNRAATPILDISTTSGITIVDAAAGKFQINPVLINQPGGRYIYDIQFTTSSIVRTFIAGAFTIMDDVTYV